MKKECLHSLWFKTLEREYAVLLENDKNQKVIKKKYWREIQIEISIFNNSFTYSWNNKIIDFYTSFTSKYDNLKFISKEGKELYI